MHQYFLNLNKTDVPRQYQIDAIEQIRAEFSKGNRKVLLRAPTGSGKSVIASEVIQGALRRDNNVIFAVRGITLIDQIHKRLTKLGVAHGVRQANHWNRNHAAKCQVVSISTIIARKDYPPADLIILDEADQATSSGYKEFISHYPNAFILAITATPYGKESLRHIADVALSPISMLKLIEKGYLSPFRYFAPSTPDMRGVRTQKGDFVNKETETKMNPLTGDIVQHWRSLGENRPTLLFAVNLNHSKMLAATFNSVGIQSEHCDALTQSSDRDLVFKRLESGDTRVLCTVGIATRGVDLPFVSCLIMARPTKSYSLFIQMCGRGTRTYPGKENCILLDHAGNILRHGLPTDEPEIFLDGYKKEPKGLTPKVCENCFVIFTGSTCHACGKTPELKPRQTEIEVNDGVLKELKGLPHAVEISLFVKQCKEIAKRKNYKRGWAYFQVREKYGEETANKAFAGMQRSREAFAWFLRKNNI